MLNFLLNNEENGAKSIISQIKLQNSLSLKKRVENSSNSLWNILFIKNHNYKLFINSISKVLSNAGSTMQPIHVDFAPKNDG